MSKIKTSMNTITKNFNKVFRAGYCDLNYIFYHDEPQYYNCGAYGWNCDIYIDYKRDIAITTGYRNMRGKSIPHELLKKYTENAKNILLAKNMINKSYDDIEKELEENREQFLKELDNL